MKYLNATLSANACSDRDSGDMLDNVATGGFRDLNSPPDSCPLTIKHKTTGSTTERLRPQKALLSVLEVAEFLHVSKATVYRLIQRRHLTFVKIGGAVRLRLSDIEGFIDAHEVKPIV